MNNSNNNNNFINYRQSYITGYLPNSNIVRAKQGLMSQEIGNDCLQSSSMNAPLNIPILSHEQYPKLEALCAPLKISC